MAAFAFRRLTQHDFVACLGGIVPYAATPDMRGKRMSASAMGGAYCPRRWIILRRPDPLSRSSGGRCLPPLIGEDRGL